MKYSRISQAESHFFEQWKLRQEFWFDACAGLYEVHRYLGNGKLAADYSDGLADALQAQNQTNESERARTRAKIARAGEPLNRVVVHIDGNQFELMETPKVKNGMVRFSFERIQRSRNPPSSI